MKRLFVLSLVLSLLFVACGGAQVSNKEVKVKFNDLWWGKIKKTEKIDKNNQNIYMVYFTDVETNKKIAELKINRDKEKLIDFKKGDYWIFKVVPLTKEELKEREEEKKFLEKMKEKRRKLLNSLKKK